MLEKIGVISLVVFCIVGVFILGYWSGYDAHKNHKKPLILTGGFERKDHAVVLQDGKFSVWVYERDRQQWVNESTKDIIKAQ